MKILRYSFLTLFLTTAALAGPILTLAPAPLTGNNGTSGWGFSLTNDTASYLSVDSVQLASPVDDPLFRFGPASNFTELFASYQFNAASILIAPNSTYSLAYNGVDEGLAAWSFPDGYDTFGSLLSGPFQISVDYSLYDDDGYNVATLDGGNPVTGTVTASTQLQYTPEPRTWILLGTGLLLAARSARKRS